MRHIIDKVFTPSDRRIDRQAEFEAMQQRIAQLETLMAGLQAENKEMKTRLHALKEKQQEGDAKRIETPPPFSQTPTTPAIEKSPVPKKPEEEITELYNAFVESQQPADTTTFLNSHHPSRFGVINVMERRRDSYVNPIFKTANDGDYIAVQMGAEWAVFPRHHFVLQESSYSYGAIEKVFDCPNYDPRKLYRRVKVVRPAIFTYESGSQTWRLEKKGELELGEGK